MRRIGAILYAIALLVVAVGAAGAANPTAPLAPVAARLAAETRSIAPAATLWLALHLEIAPGWHTYWRNPGDSGLPTEIEWTLPEGFTAGEIVWPVPERFVQGTIGSYGYSGSVDLLIPITAPAKLDAGGPVPLNAHASWLVCSDICIPGEARLALSLPIGDAGLAADPANDALFAAAREKLPKAAAFQVRFAVSDRELRLSVPAEAFTGIERPSATFFPLAPNVIDAAAEPRQELGNGGIELVLSRIAGPAANAALPKELAGVLAVRGSDGQERAYSVEALRSAPATVQEDAGIGWWQALLLAFFGGIALNLMPCVFPVLSLKVLSVAQAAHHAQERRHGIAYAAGVVLSFVLLGGLLLVLRAGGSAVGWGFQLQSPLVVALLAYLLFAMGLSLSGVAEFGARIGGLGGRFADRRGVAGAFGTGVLATVVATPCTAPFMGTALGFALLAPAPLAVAVFAAIGCGLAAPMLLFAAAPGLARLLPRPGPWMLWFKQLLAFPLYGTVAWLVWVLMQEIGPAEAFPALLGLVAVGFAVWIYGRTRLLAPRPRRFGSSFAAVGLACAMALVVAVGPGAGRPDMTGSAIRDGLGYEPFSAARLAGLTAEHRPVFVNLTAAWCITCLVNERAALDRAAVRQALTDRHIVALKGDWTRQNPEITALLQNYGRSGVPLYLLYDKAGSATVLPQILTEGAVLSALDRI